MNRYSVANIQPTPPTLLCQLETTPNFGAYVNNSGSFLTILGWLDSAGRFFCGHS